MALKLFNTLTREKEIFVPLKGRKVGLYTCGPTVYDYPHIGNMRAYTFDDILKRTLHYLGYDVLHVMNITDVGHLTSDDDTGEDKMEKGAKREKKTVWEIAQFYTDVFFEDLKKLNIIPADIICKATNHIPEQIALIQRLEQKSYTYIIEDGVYFDTSRLKDYGKLAKLDIEGLQAGARVELVKGKKNPTDFALWKFSYPNGRIFDPKKDDVATQRQMEWDSPWGRGFPGWHIECSAMSMKYLGETFDIHCGGIDHIPVHHTNEIAQSEAATGKQFVMYWLHNNFLLVEGERMAKSKGNFYKLQDLLDKGFSARAVRYLFISAHYRQQQNFTLKALEQATSTLQSLDRFVQELQTVTSAKGTKVDLDSYKIGFIQGLEDDLNLPQALGVLFELIKHVNPLLHEQKLSKKDAQVILNWLKDIDSILGFLVFEFHADIPPRVQELLNLRSQKRQEKDFQASDDIRQEIEKLGYLVKDTSQGQKVEKK